MLFTNLFFLCKIMARLKHQRQSPENPSTLKPPTRESIPKRLQKDWMLIGIQPLRLKMQRSAAMTRKCPLLWSVPIVSPKIKIYDSFVLASHYDDRFWCISFNVPIVPIVLLWNHCAFPLRRLFLLQGYGALYLVTAFPVIIGISVVLILFYNSLQ